MKIVKVIVLVVLVLGGALDAKSQFESSSPSIPKQEFFNPAFNAYKNYSSLNTMYREQWKNGLSRAPSMMGITLFVPTAKRGLGLGGTIISEDIGLRVTNSLLFTAAQGVQLGVNTYLALGLGVGAKFESYQYSKMKYYPGVDFSQVNMNQTHPLVSFGLLALLRDVFVGISTNLRVNDQDFDFTYVTGFDFCVGRIWAVNPDYIFRSTMVGKYYKETRYDSKNGVVADKFIPPVIDWSTSCLLYNKLWLGAGIRFGQAANLIMNARVTPQFNLGYKFEMGIGSGLNRFNSQGVYLTYNFIKKKKKRKAIEFYEGVFSRHSRYKKPLNEYLY
jgi:type IX secretion system PorP/SprF family membrane protein